MADAAIIAQTTYGDWVTAVCKIPVGFSFETHMMVVPAKGGDGKPRATADITAAIQAQAAISKANRQAGVQTVGTVAPNDKLSVADPIASPTFGYLGGSRSAALPQVSQVYDSLRPVPALQVSRPVQQIYVSAGLVPTIDQLAAMRQMMSSNPLRQQFSPQRFLL